MRMHACIGSTAVTHCTVLYVPTQKGVRGPPVSPSGARHYDLVYAHSRGGREQRAGRGSSRLAEQYSLIQITAYDSSNGPGTITRGRTQV